jgi:hypothetical protein
LQPYRPGEGPRSEGDHTGLRTPAAPLLGALVGVEEAASQRESQEAERVMGYDLNDLG